MMYIFVDLIETIYVQFVYKLLMELLHLYIALVVKLLQSILIIGHILLVGLLIHFALQF